MVINPDVQARAQAEVDEFTAQAGRLPDFQDREGLPFVNAVISEAFRWNPTAPLGRW